MTRFLGRHGSPPPGSRRTVLPFGCEHPGVKFRLLRRRRRNQSDEDITTRLRLNDLLLNEGDSEHHYGRWRTIATVALTTVPILM